MWRDYMALFIIQVSWVGFSFSGEEAMDIPLKRYKREYEHSYAFGVFATLEMLQHQPESALLVLLSAGGSRNEGVRKIEEICSRRAIRTEINDSAIERISAKENSYAVGVFRKYKATLSTDANHIALVNPGDMGNLGTIIRTMVGFGVKDLVLVKPAVDIFDPRVVRSSMGAIFHIAFRYFDTFAEYRSAYRRNIYTLMTNGTTPLEQACFHAPFALVFGNESAGLPEQYLEEDASVRIRHNTEIDSLNLPIAVGLTLYEATKGQFEI